MKKSDIKLMFKLVRELKQVIHQDALDPNYIVSDRDEHSVKLYEKFHKFYNLLCEYQAHYDEDY